ncbi:hypothetical protein GYA37_02405 [candidate division WWE3 bacterium]|uniref:Glycoside hydrolase family 5 domain-containing protein n=1 Tax=candidate division WWE3 bacterium TaxID=2053526 RepID=A0A7X9E7F0_UNCKA|nr:hypothetical protein [candidate division WWE3 bacterium]
MFNHKLSIKKQLDKAGSLIRRLFSLKIIRVVFIILLTLIFAPIVLFITLRPKVQSNINYGVTFSDKYAEQIGLNWKEVYIKTLDDLGTKNLRLVAYWDEIEEVKDNYDYSNIKFQLDEAEKRNLNVILSIGRKVPRYPECFEPIWWKELPSNNLRDQALLEYIKETVNTFKDYKSIKMWQVENEPFWPFGVCDSPEIKKETVIKEVELTKSLDSRPILVQDSGEGGLWKPTYKMGDYLGISMYRKIWYDFWGVFFGKFIYFQYPLSHWTYKIKANLVGVPMDKIIITELQGEPWGPGINSELSDEERDKTMSKNDFLSTISYAQKSGFKDLYLWGVEWWYFEKLQGNSFYWDTAKALFK